MEQRNIIFDGILNKINDSIDIICECNRERHLQDILSIQLRCNSREKLSHIEFSDMEVDLLGKHFAMEIKYNEKFYAGFIQILAQKLLYNLEDVYLLHLNEFIDSKYISSFLRLAKEFGIPSILINKRTKKLYVNK